MKLSKSLFWAAVLSATGCGSSLESSKLKAAENCQQIADYAALTVESAIIGSKNIKVTKRQPVQGKPHNYEIEVAGSDSVARYKLRLEKVKSFSSQCKVSALALTGRKSSKRMMMRMSQIANCKPFAKKMALAVNDIESHYSGSDTRLISVDPNSAKSKAGSIYGFDLIMWRPKFYPEYHLSIEMKGGKCSFRNFEKGTEWPHNDPMPNPRIGGSN